MLVEVALPLPIPHTFTYSIASAVQPGTRVHVPFGGRRLTGWVIGSARKSRRVQSICATSKPCSEASRAFPPICSSSARWIADYYLAPLGLVLRSALPAVLCGAVRPSSRSASDKLRAHSRGAAQPGAARRAFGRAQRQRELYELLENDRWRGRSRSRDDTARLRLRRAQGAGRAGARAI